MRSKIILDERASKSYYVTSSTPMVNYFFQAAQTKGNILSGSGVVLGGSGWFWGGSGVFWVGSGAVLGLVLGCSVWSWGLCGGSEVVLGGLWVGSECLWVVLGCSWGGSAWFWVVLRCPGVVRVVLGWFWVALGWFCDGSGVVPLFVACRNNEQSAHDEL